VSSQGVVSIGGNVIGYWPLVSGANVYREIVREGHRIPTPRIIGNGATYGTTSGVLYGGLLLLNYGPILGPTDKALTNRDVTLTYQPVFPIAQSSASTVVVESDEMIQNTGTPGTATPLGYAYYFDTGVDNNNDFVATIYVEAPSSALLALNDANEYDVRLTVAVQAGSTIQRYPIEYTIEANANSSGGFYDDWLSTDAAATSNPPADTAFLAAFNKAVPNASHAMLVGIDADSIRVNRIFRNMPVGSTFDTTDPYEYSILDPNLGELLFSPYGSSVFEDRPSGRKPLSAEVTYDVYDWRILHQDFRVPDAGTSSTLNYSLPCRGLRALGVPLPDGSVNEGLNVPIPDWDPANNVRTTSNEPFVLIDADTGGVYLPADYSVDYGRGIVTFPNTQAQVLFPNATTLQTVSIVGRPVRALFMLNGDWAFQVQKASSDYDETYTILPGAGQFYVGGGVLGGSNTRIYFPKADLGQVVRFDEIDYVTAGGSKTMRGQSMQITSAQNDALGPFVDITSLDSGATTLDSSNGFGGVMGVHGASLSLRAVWEDSGQLALSKDTTANAGLLTTYRESYHTMRQATSFLGGETQP
jgi:hypothetical protein